MNIFKSKKPITMALTFVIFMAMVQPPLLTAKERRGSTVVVNMADGRVVKGELLAVKADALLIYNSKGERLDLQQVVQVKVLKKSKFLQGFVVGYGAGLGSSLLAINKDSIVPLSFLFILPAIPGLLGGLLGSIAGAPAKISLDGKVSRIRQENIERLKRYAREQDYEKPAETIFADIMASTLKTEVQSPRVQQKWHRHRFGLLIFPGHQSISRSSDFSPGRGTFRFVNNVSSKDTATYWFKSFSESFPSGTWRIGQLRLEYEWTPNFTPSIEFISSGKLGGEARMDLSYYSSDYAREYHSRINFNNEYSYASLLLGLNLKSFLPASKRKNIFELGIAAGPSWAQVNLDSRYSDNLNPPHKFKDLTWTAKVHAAYDYFYTDNFSLGVFISYQYLRASFPSATFNEKRQFQSDYWLNYNHFTHVFTRQTEFTIPGYSIQLGGMAYGLRAGVRF